MKNWKLLLNIALLSAFVVWGSGCDTEDDTLPDVPIIGNVDVTPADDAVDGEDDLVIFVNSGEDVVFTVDVTTPGGFNVARVYYNGTIVDEQTRNDLGLAAGLATVNDIELTIPNVTEAGVATIEVVDDVGQDNSIDYTINVIETATFTSVLLFAPTGNEDSETFFSTNLGQAVTKNQVDDNTEGTPMSNDVDFGYAYGPQTGINIASPAAYPTFVGYDLSVWNTLHETTFKLTTIDNETYLGADTSEELQNIYTNAADPAAGRKSSLNVGDILAFQLDPDKGANYGLMKIISLVDGNNDGAFTGESDYIEIEVTIER
ncbi:MAG: hypothetical protein ACNS60_05440 [Candidatus Cyclobacteriaceae bacterium M2_1C_046]